MSRYRKLTLISCATALAFGLAACSGSSSDNATVAPPPDPAPDPVAVEQQAIDNAIAAAAAAAGMVTDTSTDAEVEAADMAVAAAMAAISGATRIDASAVRAANASLATVQSQLTAAKASRMTAMDLANQRIAISDAIAAATTAVGAVNDDSDDATVSAAQPRSRPSRQRSTVPGWSRMPTQRQPGRRSPDSSPTSPPPLKAGRLRTQTRPARRRSGRR